MVAFVEQGYKFRPHLWFRVLVSRVCLCRPLLLLGGVADALTEALAVSKEKDSIGAARAADACASALGALMQEIPSIEEGLLALD